jgi:hypothetical protein
MKYSALLLFLLFACNASSNQKDPEINDIRADEENDESFERVEGVDYDGLEAEQNLDDFILAFEEAIMNHDAELCLTFFDEEYKQEQLDFLDGNLDQFLRRILMWCRPTRCLYLYRSQ